MRRLVWQGGASMRMEESSGPPPRPGRDEVLLKVRSVGICGTDIHIMNGAFSAAKPPLVLGHEISGEIAMAGRNVDNVREGDRVTVDAVVGCGHCDLCRRNRSQFCPEGFELGISRDGGCQDYIILPKTNVYRIADTVSFEEAAILDMEVYNAVRKCGIEPSDNVLVLGAGPIGIIACQVARILGAGHVVLGDVLERRVNVAEALGVADGYWRIEEGGVQEDPANKSLEAYDVVIDCAGTPQSVQCALQATRACGRVLLYGVHESRADQVDLNQIVLKDLVVFGAQSDRNGWQDVIDLVTSGALNLNSLITHRLPLEEGHRAYELVRRQEEAVIKAVLLL